MTWHKTHCARMDHGGCAIRVRTESGRIRAITGDGDGYLNRGFICPKGRALARRLDHPDRLKRPLKRISKRGEGRFRPVTWEEALNDIASAFSRIKERYGARSVAFCQGMPKGLEHFALIRLANCFGSPNVVAVQDVCHAPREIAGRLTCGFYPVSDFHHRSRLIMVWGSNPLASNEEGVTCRLLSEQLERKTRLIVVDPRRTELAKRSELWLGIRPGTDIFLALAILNTLISENLYDSTFVKEQTLGFSELKKDVAKMPPEKAARITGLSAEKIRAAARLYATHSPACIHWGNALEQTENAFDACRAIVCIMAICGNLDRPGGNIHALEPRLTPLGRFVRTDLLPEKGQLMLNAYHKTAPYLMTVPPAFFKKAAIKGVPYPVRGAYVQCSNPLITWADSPKSEAALKSLEFLAVADIFMTPTAAMADIVLPAATHLEFDDIGHLGLGHGILLARPKIVDPPSGCRPDIWIINELGKRITDCALWFDNTRQMIDELLAPLQIDFNGFAKKGFVTGEQRFFKYRKDGFKTPSKKVMLKLSDSSGIKGLPEIPPSPETDPAFPLTLTSAKDPLFLHSSYRWIEQLRRKSPLPRAIIHKDIARALSIMQDDPIRIITPHGSFIQFADLTEDIEKKTVCASYGWWFSGKDPLDPEMRQKFNYNMATTCDMTGREFGTPNLKGLPCRIEKAQGEKIP